MERRQPLRRLLGDLHPLRDRLIREPFEDLLSPPPGEVAAARGFRLGDPQVEELLQASGPGAGGEVRGAAAVVLRRGPVRVPRHLRQGLGGGPERLPQLVLLETALLHHRLPVGHADERVPGDHIPAQVGERQPGDERREPERHGGDLGTHRAHIHAEEAVFQQQPPEQRQIRDAPRPFRVAAQFEQSSRERRERPFGEEPRGPVRQRIQHLDQEVGAAAGRVEHGEVEQSVRRLLRIGVRQIPHLFQVLLEGRRDGALHQVPHQRGRRVIDAAGLPAAEVGLPQERTRGNRVLAGAPVAVAAPPSVFLSIPLSIPSVLPLTLRELRRTVAVALRVVGDGPGGEGQVPAQQGFVEVSQVADLDGRIVHAAVAFLVPAQRGQHPSETGIAHGEGFQRLGAGEGRLGEERPVVGGDAPGAVPPAHGAHQADETQPQRFRCVVERLLFPPRFLHQFGEAPLPVVGVGQRQVTGALRVEQEEEAEAEREGGLLQFLALARDRQVETLLLGPPRHLPGERRERLVAEAPVEPLPERHAVVARILQFPLEAALGEGRRGEQGEERARLLVHLFEVELDPAGGAANGFPGAFPGAGAGPDLEAEQAQPAAARQQAVADSLDPATLAEQALAGPVLLVEAVEVRCLGERQHQRHPV